jgi:NAD(P)-dependent dehydrogenase (short-subunit alcohol dehydrogenase family)
LGVVAPMQRDIQALPAPTTSLGEAVDKNAYLAGRVALVTGASSGIGRAIVLALCRHGARVCVVGRDGATLAETAAAARRFSKVDEFQIDLTVQETIQPLIRHLEDETGRLDILVHSAGVIHQDSMESARIEDLDVQYATNVRAPYLLTQQLLPILTRSKGQIVFVNSSAGVTAKRPEIGQYAATKHAMKAIADSLREEVNPKGIRVLSVFLGRTATPMQADLYRRQGTPYRPETLLQPEDVASVVLNSLLLPPTAEVTDIHIRPMQKPC